MLKWATLETCLGTVHGDFAEYQAATDQVRYDRNSDTFDISRWTIPNMNDLAHPDCPPRCRTFEKAIEDIATARTMEKVRQIMPPDAAAKSGIKCRADQSNM